MAVTETAKAAAGMRAGSAKPARGASVGAAQYNGVAFVATAVGWLALLLGERVLASTEGLGKLCTWLAVALLIGSFGQRLWALSASPADRRGMGRAFAVLSGAGVLALGLYFATTDWGREFLGKEKPQLGKGDSYGEVLTVAWITLCVTSIIPSLLGELARLSMKRAEKVESRRVIAAVVAGTALSLAAAYGALFSYAAGKVDWRVDYSYFRVARPSDSTRKMVESLEQPLQVMVFFPSHSEVREQVVTYLEDLQKGSSKLEIQVHDRLLVPDIAKEHKVTHDGVMVLVRDKMSQTVDIGVDEGKAASKLKKLDGEFQKALLKAMRDKRTAYLTVGHGELNEENDKKTGRAVTGLRTLLESQNYGIKNLGAAEGLGSEVPEDASVVMVLGPTEAFGEPEVLALKRYAERGGKLFLALDPEQKIDLSALAEMVGVKWEQNVVVNDQVSYRVARNDSDKKVLVAKRFSSHASVSSLSKLAAKGAAVLVGGSAPLDKLESAGADLKIDFALKSTAGSYVDLDGDWTFDDGTEKKNTFNLAAAVSRGVEGAAERDKQGLPTEMRAFLLGDADMLSDPYMDFAKTNRLLFVEAVRWLGGDESFTGEIEEEEDVRIVHTKQEDQIWFYGAILGVPGLVLGAGLFVTTRSRKRKADKPPAPKREEKKAKPKEPEPEDEASDEEQSP